MESVEIYFFNEDIDFTLKNQHIISNWISIVISQENKTLGEINYIFCSDNYLLELNQNYLKHDTYTDVITFDYVEGNLISGDIFISIDRIVENAKNIETTFDNELSRVMIHGVLHLIGYRDKTPDELQVIRGKEDFYLALQSEK